MIVKRQEKIGVGVVWSSKRYAVSEDLSADCLWEGLFPTVTQLT